MRRKSFGIIRVLPLCSLLIFYLLLSGCGGGGGSSNRNADLVGDYLVHQIGINGSGLVYTSQVDVTANGDGTGSFSIVRHSEGTTGGADFTYTVAANHTFTVTTSAGTDSGILSSDDSLFLIVDATTGGSDSVVAVAMRKDCLTPPTLSGIYRIGQIGVNTSGAAPVIETKLVDATISVTPGNGTFSIVKDSGGAPGSGDFTYTVNADCTITVNNSVDNDFGIVSADGSRFVLVDADHADADSEIVLAIGIQQHANAGDSLFDGNYWLGQVGNASATSYTARVDLTANGDGTGSATVVANSQGGAPNPPVALTYSINPADGITTVNDGSTTTDAMIDAAGELIFNIDTDPSDGAIHLNTGLLY